jgi:hypothetical protein
LPAARVDEPVGDLAVDLPAPQQMFRCIVSGFKVAAGDAYGRWLEMLVMRERRLRPAWQAGASAI